MRRRKIIPITQGHKEITDLLKNSNELITSAAQDDYHVYSKKRKYDARIKQNDELTWMKLLDEQIENTIRTGIRIYNKKEFNDENYSNQEKLSYLMILKKIQDPKEWVSKRVISNKYQIQCVLGKNITSKEKYQHAMSIMEQWNEYKIKGFPGKYRKASCEDIAKHYANRFMLEGLELSTLLFKIKELSSFDIISSSHYSNTNHIMVGSHCDSQNYSNLSSSVSSTNEECCRLCGDSKSELVIKLDKNSHNSNFKSVVEYFCRVKISNDDRLPQMVCINCKNTLDYFSKFTKKVMNHQQKINDELPSSTIIIKSETEEHREDPITIDDYSPQIILESNPLVPDSSSNRYTYSTIDLPHSSEEEKVIDSTKNINNNDYENIPTITCTDSESSQRSTLIYDYIEPERENRMLISNINMKTMVKQCFVKISRLPIHYNPSDTEDSDLENDDIFKNGFIPQSSSPILAPKFRVKEEPEDEMIEISTENNKNTHHEIT